MAEIAAIVTGIAGIVAGVVYLFKRFPRKTPAQKQQETEQDIIDEINKGKKTGRPGND